MDGHKENLTEEEMEETVQYGLQEEEPAFYITRNSDGSWNLSGDKIEKLYKMTNFDHDESSMRFARQLRAMGVDEALRARGAKDGDYIYLDDFIFEFIE